MTARKFNEYIDLEIAMDNLLDRVEEIRGTRPTQIEISTMTGVPQGTISKWSNGYVSRLDKHIILSLLNFFNQYFECKLDDLIVPIKVLQEQDNP